jgi:GH18 family chitinase
MKRFASLLSFCLFSFLLTFCAPMQTQIPDPISETISIEKSVPPFRIIAYATEDIDPKVIPYHQLTHINYSFLIPNSDGTFVSLINAQKLKMIIETAHSQNVRVSVAVGGWGWDDQFEQMAASAESRALFIKNLTDFVNDYQLDGVDIDWEYPDPGESAQNYLALMEELRIALPDALISTAVIGAGDEYGLGFPAEVFDIVDYVNVMTYDGPDHGSMEQFNEGIQYWSVRGVSKGKINIGVPFYSRPGEIPYKQLVEFSPAASQKDTFDFSGVTQQYNGIPTIQKKAKLAMQNAGGIMFWELSHDTQGDLSLVNAIFEVVNSK